MEKPIRPNGSYLDRLVQLIPAEIVAAHLAVQGVVANNIDTRNLALEISAGVLFVLLPLYLWRLQGVRSALKILLTMGSFVIWVYAVSSPVYTRWSLEPVWGSVALILWTTVIPAIHFEDGQD